MKRHLSPARATISLGLQAQDEAVVEAVVGAGVGVGDGVAGSAIAVAKRFIETEDVHCEAAAARTSLGLKGINV